AVPGRRRRVRVPRCLAVVVGVNVDEARRHDAAFGVDLLGAGARDLADCRDASVPDGDIGLARLSPRAVDHRAVTDDEVILVGHGVSSDVDCPDRYARCGNLRGQFTDPGESRGVILSSLISETDMKVGVLQFFGWRDRSVPLRSIYDMALERIAI